MKALTWLAVAKLLATQPPGSRLRLRRPLTQHPKDGRLVPVLGLPVGQRADYRLDYGGDQLLYIQDFGTHLEARLELRHPVIPPTARNAAAEGDEASAMLAGAAAGGLLGFLLGRSSSSAFTGLLFGAVAGIAASAADPAKGPLSEKPKLDGTPQLAKQRLAKIAASAVTPSHRALSENRNSVGTIRLVRRDLTAKPQPQNPWPPGKKGTKP